VAAIAKFRSSITEPEWRSLLLGISLLHVCIIISNDHPSVVLLMDIISPLLSFC
jgi:hypothetical protein